MDREQEIIHHKMEETRSDLTDKLAKLEDQVGGTVQAATDVVQNTTEAVTGTVESVKETVENVTEKLHETVADVTDSVQQAVETVKESVDETVRTVAESLNLRLQCERHPWLVFGGAVAVGCLGGMLLGGSRRQEPSSTSRSGSSSSLSGFTTPTHEEPRRESSWMQTATESAKEAATGATEATGWIWDKLKGLRSLALGALMATGRELVTQVVPESLKERVSEEVDNLTKSFGGEPIKGDVLGQNQSQGAEQPEKQDGSSDESKGKSDMSSGRSGQPVMAGNGR